MTRITTNTLIFLGIFILSVIRVAWSRIKMRPQPGLPKQVPLTWQGRHQVFLGALIAMLVILPSIAHVGWSWRLFGVLVGASVGALGGFLVGRAEGKVWRAFLDREGSIPIVIQRGQRTLWLLVVLGLVLVTLVIGFLRPEVSLKVLASKLFLVVCSGSMMAMAGFHWAWGTYFYFWAKRREREGRGQVLLKYSLR